MPFIGTILLLAALVSAILIPIFVGHSLAAHATTYLWLALAFVPVSALFIFLYSRVAARADRVGTGHGHAHH